MAKTKLSPEERAEFLKGRGPFTQKDWETPKSKLSSIKLMSTVDQKSIVLCDNYKPQVVEFNKFRQTKGYQLYAFTCKINGIKVQLYPNINAKCYEPFFDRLYKLSEVVTYCGEADSKGLLHYHGVIRIPTNFFRKNLRVKGYHLYLKRIYRLRFWVDYCFKNNVLYNFRNMKKCLI